MAPVWCAGLMGAIILGPRIGRFLPDGKVEEFLPASPTNQAIGVFILWLGWWVLGSYIWGTP